MCLYVYVYMHTHAHAHTHTQTNTFTYTYTYTYKCTYNPRLCIYSMQTHGSVSYIRSVTLRS